VTPHHSPAHSSLVPSPAKPKDLARFLAEQGGFLKCSLDSFLGWLMSEDIASLSDLADAVTDDDCLDNMVGAGLKKFKRAAFRKTVLAASLQ